MTCDEFRSARGRGEEALTDSLVLALTRHYLRCLDCRRFVTRSVADPADQEQLARDQREAQEVFDRLARNAQLDPKLGEL